MKSTTRRPDLGAVLFALAFPSLLTWAYFVLLPNRAPRWQRPVYVLGKALQFLFPLAWVLAVQRGRPAWRRPRPAGVIEGLLFGSVVFAAASGVYGVWLGPSGMIQSAAAEIQAKVAGFGVHRAGTYVALAAFYSLIHSLLEEYYWRWFVFGQLRAMIAWPAAVVVSSLGFMAHHVIVLAAYFGWASPWTYLFSLSVALGGAYWAWLYHRSGSLVGPWLSHLLVDAAIFAVGYDLVRPMFG